MDNYRPIKRNLYKTLKKKSRHHQTLLGSLVDAWKSETGTDIMDARYLKTADRFSYLIRGYSELFINLFKVMVFWYYL